LARRPKLFLALLLLAFEGACWQHPAEAEGRGTDRAGMVRRQIAARGVRDPRVLKAMEKVPRHLFVPAVRQAEAYEDYPLPIGGGQTISQPYIVAAMTEALRLKPGSRVLEIGTGSGYQAAILGELAREVYSIEIVPALGQRAAKLLAQLGYRNIQVHVGDGYRGWPERAPFDAILLTAAPVQLPEPLLRQLKMGGTLVAPVGPTDDQRLIRVTKTVTGFSREHLMDVRFVPMTGKAQEGR
jgi:protein-L-isoaspartate(D-aspartate) O-methyltransferase